VCEYLQVEVLMSSENPSALGDAAPMCAQAVGSTHTSLCHEDASATTKPVASSGSVVINVRPGCVSSDASTVNTEHLDWMPVLPHEFAAVESCEPSEVTADGGDGVQPNAPEAVARSQGRSPHARSTAQPYGSMPGGARTA